jgi:hypothetical protein
MAHFLRSSELGMSQLRHLSAVFVAALVASGCGDTFGSLLSRHAHFSLAAQTVGAGVGRVDVAVELDAATTGNLAIPVQASGTAVAGTDFLMATHRSVSKPANRRPICR